MENNKIVASILLAGLIAMLSGTFSKMIYPAGGYSKDETERGYSVEVVEAAGAGEAKEEINIFAMIANADASKGEKVAKKCLACHGFEKDAAHKVGPALWGVMGKEKAAKAGFQYSKALKEKGGVWDYEAMWAFINKPSSYVSGTKMAFAGIRKPDQLADLIAYMREKADSPIALPDVPAEEPKIEEAAKEGEAKTEEAKPAS